jgi:NAD-reducing hydrogenase large subunit
VTEFASFPSNYMSLVREADGALDLYHGRLRAMNATGGPIFDMVDYTRYHEDLVEDVRSWSYMKFPYHQGARPRERLVSRRPAGAHEHADFIDTPLANAALADLRTVTMGSPNNSTLANHWARMIEVVHCVEKIRELLHDPDLQGTDLIGHRGPPRGRHRRDRGAARQSDPSLQGR